MKYFCSFSEAIREGASFKPQGFKAPNFRTVAGTSCAVEAGIEALEIGIEWCDECALCELFPYLGTLVSHPKCATVQQNLYSLCWMLNDEGWTREQVADWLESEEEKLGFVHLIESESPASRPELSVDLQPVASRAGVGIENKSLRQGSRNLRGLRDQGDWWFFLLRGMGERSPVLN